MVGGAGLLRHGQEVLRQKKVKKCCPKPLTLKKPTLNLNLK